MIFWTIFWLVQFLADVGVAEWMIIAINETMDSTVRKVEYD